MVFLYCMIFLNANTLQLNFSTVLVLGSQRERTTEKRGARVVQEILGSLCRTYYQALSAPFPTSDLRNTLEPPSFWDMWEQISFLFVVSPSGRKSVAILLR